VKGDDPKLSPAAGRRLSQYLRVLRGDRGAGTVSSESLAKSVGVSAAQVRRDLASLGHLGQRGVGYDVTLLADAIRHTLGIHREWRAVLIGVGNLARALLRYRGFAEQGFHIVGLFDADPAKIGTSLERLSIEPMENLVKRVQDLQAELAILTIPSDAAAAIAETLATAGIRGILNFAPTLIRTPATTTIPIVSVDLAIQIEQLAFQVQARSGARVVE